MLTAAELLLLLAAAASQVHLSLSVPGAGRLDISQCPITLFGREYSQMEVSYSNSLLAVCSVGASPDCIYVEDPQGLRANPKILPEATNPGSLVHTFLPYIQSASPCLVEVELQDQTNSSHLLVLIYNFGSQAVLQLNATNLFTQSHINVSVTISGNSLYSVSFQRSDWQNGVILDVSGCRSGDQVLLAGSETYQPESCSNMVCNQSAVLSVVSACGADEMCSSNAGCAPRPSVCSVSGSTIMDFFSRVHSITNRCVYSLMEAGGDSGFELLAAFRERRRRDVMFLDRLILWLKDPNVTIYLEQGGRVQVEHEILELNATSGLVHGVQLSKDQMGVTASIPAANVTVYFDGSAAHVAGRPRAVEGLCGNPGDSSQNGSVSAARSTSYSEAGCDTEYADVVDPTIDCNSTSRHCDLMRQPPFTACHKHTDPEPYITACKATLCNYPAVDGLKCRFLEAYAKSCSLQNDVHLGDWRPAFSCPAVPPVLCLDLDCSHHEFCGVENGRTRCLCRANFASKYRAANALGEPTVCMQSSATLSLAGCLLEDKGVDYTRLHLTDESCPGHVDNQTHMVTFSFDLNNNCGTEVIMNNSQIVYKNSIVMRNSSADKVISRHSRVDIDFSCYYEKPPIKTVAFKVKDSTVIEHIVSGMWNYTLIMKAYTDPERTQPVLPTAQIGLNQRIWVELTAEGLDQQTVALVIHSCWSTDRPSPDEGVRYDLIVERCPNTKDQTVQMDGNGAGTSNLFSFNMFEFPGDEDGIYLHCQLELCLKQGNSCIQVCGTRRRRRAFQAGGGGGANGKYDVGGTRRRRRAFQAGGGGGGAGGRKYSNFLRGGYGGGKYGGAGSGLVGGKYGGGFGGKYDVGERRGGFHGGPGRDRRSVLGPVGPPGLPGPGPSGLIAGPAGFHGGPARERRSLLGLPGGFHGGPARERRSLLGPPAGFHGGPARERRSLLGPPGDGGSRQERWGGRFPPSGLIAGRPGQGGGKYNGGRNGGGFHGGSGRERRSLLLPPGTGKYDGGGLGGG